MTKEDLANDIERADKAYQAWFAAWESVQRNLLEFAKESGNEVTIALEAGSRPASYRMRLSRADYQWLCDLIYQLEVECRLSIGF